MINRDLKRCTGCEACVQICPQKCISVEDIGNGFLYPKINIQKCINCSFCEKVCPIEKNDIYIHPRAYAAVNKTKSLLINASSGGAFNAIASYVLQKNGVIYGCAFNKQLKAKHIRVDSFEKLPLLYGSKYVQSDINKSFLYVKNDLEAGKLVVFSGTPCQIAGLKNFLGKKFDNLITIDIICHGVPSQAYFDKYKKWLETRKDGFIIDYQFRSKSNHGWSLSGEYSYIKRDENKIIKSPLFYYDNYFYFYFLESSIYRECCYSCKYASLNREGDFTLGDLWGAERFKFDFDTSSGCSLVLANNSKANELLKQFNLYKSEIDLETAAKYNAQLYHPSNRHPLWEKRIDDFINISAQEIQNDFMKKNHFARLKGKIKYLIPLKMVNIINRIRYRIVT